MRIAIWLARCMVVTAGLCFSITPSIAQDHFITDAVNIPASVNNVDAGGYWSDGGSEGFFRTIVLAGGVEQVGHRLYVQWIAVSSETQDYRLIRTVNVKEFNEGHGVILQLVTDFATLDQLTASIEATSVRGGEVRRYVLTATKDGVYRLTSE